MRSALIFSAIVVGFAGMLAFAASSVEAWRFPTSDVTVEELNASPDALANTRAAFALARSGETVPFRVLFYGQSIIGSGWGDLAMADLARLHPNMVFQWDNRSIGGFSAENLVHTASADLADLSPDLIVFHVYGDHRAYERTVVEMLRRTGADIILQTDHADTIPEPRCQVGLTLLVAQPKGCRSWPLLRQGKWRDYMSYHFIPALAERLHLAVQPVRQVWTDRLRAEGRRPEEVLKDGLHLNDEGRRWMADFFVDFIEQQTARSEGASRRRLLPLPQSDASGVRRLQTDADRVELVSRQPLGPLSIRIDGEAAEEHPSCVAHGRPTGSLPDHPWPSVRKVSSESALVPEEWRVTMRDFSEDYSDFAFDVVGSVTGPDGTGRAGDDFRSGSGRVILDQADWTTARLFAEKGVPIPDPLTVTFSARFLCDDVAAVGSGGVTQFYMTTLFVNTGGGEHVLDFVLAPESAAGIMGVLLTDHRQ
ncbi:hypothetical protein EF888_10015 [Silicimonas algicola]|uniref:Lysophospholipase L1-like esterase n=1 Tax=Silicimonas algicola TaxID=1826607 RepID=A0A316G967_9RHOB|nr:hypothetical protein [Silicimonas algicola]AZQ67437.1 hypothetical protein EF888_10015 [Silicimonas algicola]PWK57123.1 lysophospholipase L1-like esterase [Silicimonas algicola]